MLGQKLDKTAIGRSLETIQFDKPQLCQHWAPKLSDEEAQHIELMEIDYMRKQNWCENYGPSSRNCPNKVGKKDLRVIGQIQTAIWDNIQNREEYQNG